jgi:hypothetical protein
MRKIFLLLVLATSALAADFTGNWSGEGVMKGESHPLHFVLKQQDGTLTGTGGPSASEQHPFQIASIDGEKIVLEVAVGDKGTIHFELKMEGDTLQGTVELRHGDGIESGTVKLKKDS